MLNINLAQLIGNSFAFYLDKTGNRILTVNQLEDFGCAVIQDLENENIDACLSDSFDKLPQFIDEYPNWFSCSKDNSSILLNKNVSVDDLLNMFAGDLSPYEICAFGSNENLEVLLA